MWKKIKDKYIQEKKKPSPLLGFTSSIHKEDLCEQVKGCARDNRDTDSAKTQSALEMNDN